MILPSCIGAHAWIKERLGKHKRNFNNMIDGFVASGTATNKSFVIKPALCSDADAEFSRRQQLFLKLFRSGRHVEIPESLFLKLPNGNYYPIPASLIDEYNVIISDNQKIEKPSPKRLLTVSINNHAFVI